MTEAQNHRETQENIAAAEAACLNAFTPAFQITHPKTLTSPIIFTSPHSGKIYPPEFISRSARSLAELRQNEDALIDTLFAPSAALGAPLLCALFPRCYVDANRAENELPPGWGDTNAPLTTRAKAGYGVIPLAIAENMPIYKTLPPANITATRIENLYRPYHAALAALIKDAKDNFGQALIIDCHSMPGFAPMGARRADIVLGDRYGTSCSPETIAFVERQFRACGYSVTRNYPYAGGYVTSHYSESDENIEALQIEINRDLYLNPITLKPKRSYDTLAGNLETIITETINGYSAPAVAAAE